MVVRLKTSFTVLYIMFGGAKVLKDIECQQQSMPNVVTIEYS